MLPRRTGGRGNVFAFVCQSLSFHSPSYYHGRFRNLVRVPQSSIPFNPCLSVSRTPSTSSWTWYRPTQRTRISSPNAQTTWPQASVPWKERGPSRPKPSVPKLMETLIPARIRDHMPLIFLGHQRQRTSRRKVDRAKRIKGDAGVLAPRLRIIPTAQKYLVCPKSSVLSL